MTRRTSSTAAHLHERPSPTPQASGLHDIHFISKTANYGRMRRGDRVDRSLAQVPISNASSRAIYDGAELRAHVRPGALAAYSLPSRVNNRLHFPDGRTTDMQGNPITNRPERPTP